MNRIDEYIAGFPGPVRKRLTQVRRAIRAEAQQATEVWSYGIPTFDLNGKHLVHFAGYARHIGFYPGAAAAAAFKKQFAVYKNAKGSVQFPHDEPLPLPLIRKVVRFRLNMQPVRKR